jgi:hypothetical protein
MALAPPLEDITSGEDVAAMKALASPREDPLVAKAALARLLKSRRHLVWRSARTLKPALNAELLALCRKSNTIEGRFFTQVAPKGLDVLRSLTAPRSRAP